MTVTITTETIRTVTTITGITVSTIHKFFIVLDKNGYTNVVL